MIKRSIYNKGRKTTITFTEFNRKCIDVMFAEFIDVFFGSFYAKTYLQIGKTGMCNYICYL